MQNESETSSDDLRFTEYQESSECVNENEATEDKYLLFVTIKTACLCPQFYFYLNINTILFFVLTLYIPELHNKFFFSLSDV